MSDFEPAIEAQLAGATVVMAVLIKIAFASETAFLWTGVGERSFGGERWTGIGSVISISEITRLQNGQADPFEIAVVADEEILRRGLIEFNDEAKDREISVYLQFLDFEADAPLGPPWQIRDGVMRGASLAVGGDSMVLSITCDTLSSRRNRPAFGMLTDRDQKARFPDDRGLEFVHDTDGREILWPVF
ncbi:MAG: hypothetical protein IPK75_12820 [Acidobacteria bacterium]|nr:hypothetical protein [Acidobacteriota bacterium]